MPGASPTIDKSFQKVRQLVLIPMLVFLVGYAVVNANKCTIGFVSGYTAAVGLKEGADITTYYQDEHFGERVGRICEGTFDIFSPNPPTYSLMMLPLTPFRFPVAKSIWIVLNLAMLAVVVLLLRRHLAKVGILEILPFVVLFQPMYSNLRMGQNYIFILLMITIIWLGWKSDRPWWVVCGLILMTIFKLGLVWVWPLLVVNRKWKEVIFAGIGVLLICAMTVPWLGLESWQVFLQELSKTSGQGSGGVTAYQAIPGFFKHFFNYDPVWNPGPILDHQFLGNLLPRIISILLVLLTLVLGALSKNKDLKIVMVVIVSVITSPFTLDYHYPVLIIAFLLLYGKLEMRWQKIAFFGSYLAIALPLPYTSDLFNEGLLSLLAYPKLYGAMLLLFICMKMAFDNIRKERMTLLQNSRG